MSIDQFIDNEVKSNDVVLFMKGTPQFPMCGFSGQVVQILDHLGVTYKGLNVLESDDLRNGIKTFSNWPTIPQLYVKGEFVGGCDIIREMFQAGELQVAAQGQGRGGQGHGLSRFAFRFPLLTARAAWRPNGLNEYNRLGKRHAVEDARSCARESRSSSPPLKPASSKSRIDAVEPFIDGHAFGAVGPYERVKGIAKGELDPSARENAGIVDLDKAPRNARGMVEYEVDIFILRPADPAKGSGILYLRGAQPRQQAARHAAARRDVGRRGVAGRRAQRSEDAARTPAMRFVFERGYTVVWSAWDPDVSNANAAHDRALPGGDGERQADRAPHPRGDSRSASAGPPTSRPCGSTIRPRPTDKQQGAADRARAREGDPAHRGSGRPVGVRRARIDSAACRRARNSRRGDLRALVRGDRKRRSSASALPRRATWCRSCATRRADDKGTANPLAGQGARHPPCAGVRRLAEPAASCATTSSSA